MAGLVHACTGGSSAEAIERIASLADGVPFLVEEMLASPGLPASFAEGVQVRLSELPDPDRRVLVTPAVFGRHFDWHLLSPATGMPEGDVVDALDRGVAAQLLAVEDDQFRFRHALTAEAVFQSVIPPRRERLAAAALEALDAVHGELPAALRDVAAGVAERAGQHERAGRLHLASGEAALERGALQTAVVALERATSLPRPGDARDLAYERLVHALVLAGRVDDALVVGHDLIPRLPSERAAAVRPRLADAAPPSNANPSLRRGSVPPPGRNASSAAASRTSSASRSDPGGRSSVMPVTPRILSPVRGSPMPSTVPTGAPMRSTTP